MPASRASSRSRVLSAPTFRRYAAGFLLVAISLLGTLPAASAQWKMVKKFVQPGVEIVEETKSFMILKHPELDLLVVLAYNDPESEADIDIQGATEQLRGGNPYRVWIARDRFWNDPDRPREVWGQFFRVEFLKILRPPSHPLNASP